MDVENTGDEPGESISTKDSTETDGNDHTQVEIKDAEKEKNSDDIVTLNGHSDNEDEQSEAEKSVLEKTGDGTKGEMDESNENQKDDDEVITLDDDSNISKVTKDDDANISKQTKEMIDHEFFNNVSQEEKDFYDEEGVDPADIEDMTIQCTACWKQVNHHIRGGINRHPLLGVPVCRSCKNFYQEDEVWEKDEEGYDMYCRWCGNGGDLLCCDKCTNAFCKTCIRRNKGRAKVAEITNSDEWECFVCRPNQIFEIRALAYAIYKWQTTMKKKQENKKKIKEKEMLAKKKEDARKKVREEKQKEKELKMKEESSKIENFIDENISEAFDTLAIYQKCLEDEKKKWVRARKQMNANNSAVAAKNLRKIYAITKQNMDLLDTALVQAYGDQFPEESEKKLKFGNLATSSPGEPKRTPAKSPKSPNKHAHVKKKVKKIKTSSSTTPKSVLSATPSASGDDDIAVEEIVVNGEPVFGLDVSDDDDMFDPSQLCSVEITQDDKQDKPVPKKSTTTPVSQPQRKLPAGAAVSRPGQGLKVSTNMFKKKTPVKKTPQKRVAPVESDSDIEEITIDDDDDDEDEANDDTAYESQSYIPTPKKRKQSADSDVSLE